MAYFYLNVNVEVNLVHAQILCRKKTFSEPYFLSKLMFNYVYTGRLKKIKLHEPCGVQLKKKISLKFVIFLPNLDPFKLGVIYAFFPAKCAFPKFQSSQVCTQEVIFTLKSGFKRVLTEFWIH